MLTETEPRTAAKVNLNAVFGCLELLVEQVPAAGEILRKDPRPTSIAFAVRHAGAVTLKFADGRLAFERGRDKPTILIPFPTPKAFNKVIDGAAPPIPVAGLLRVPFLLKVFAPLTELLTRYLKPSAEDLSDPEFQRICTLLQLQVLGNAIAEVGNNDRSGRFSAAQMVDGDIAVEVTGGPTLTIRVRDHQLTFLPVPDGPPRAALTFANLEVAGQLLRGELSALAGICDGRIAMRGMISMVDNLNRILDRVSDYLAD